jgi:mannitol/fructose-specific phosphotransferase system IIA component (Ntr-type)
MDLGDFLGPVDLHAENRWGAIDELIKHLVTTHKISTEHRDAIARRVRKRESSMTTGIGFGIAIPHALTDVITEVLGVIGRSRKGIQFDAVDGQPVNLVILFLVPQGQFQKQGSPTEVNLDLVARVENQTVRESPVSQGTSAI